MHRNNFGNNNNRPYPASGNGYSYDKSRMLSEERMVEVEKATKNFMQSQYEQNQLFTKTMNEPSAMLKNIGHQLKNLNRKFLRCKLRFLLLKPIFHPCLKYTLL